MTNPIVEKALSEIAESLLRLLIEEVSKRGPEIVQAISDIVEGTNRKKQFHNSHWCTDCKAENLPNPVEIVFVYPGANPSIPIARSLCPNCGLRRRHDPIGCEIKQIGTLSLPPVKEGGKS